VTGAGGGGCVISLLPLAWEEEATARAHAFQRAVEKSGMETFETKIGQEGLILEAIAENRSNL